jgi:cell division septal protein FtsQ
MTRARGASRPRFRFLPTVLLTLAILGLPTVVYAWGRSSSSFDIVSIHVEGTHLVSEKRVHRLLLRDFRGRNLFTVTQGDVRSTLRSLCFVSSVQIDRDFPDTLRVTISEYVPAVYALAGGRWFVLDEDGYAICTASRAEDQIPGGSPAPSSSPSPKASATPASGNQATDGSGTKGTATGSPSLGKLRAGPAAATLRLPRLAVSGRVREGSAVRDKAVAGMLRVITALPGSLRRRLAVVQDRDGQLTLRFAGGPVTTWGDTQRTLAKTVALRTVLARYADAGQTCTRLDVSIPDRTLAKPVLQ